MPDSYTISKDSPVTRATVDRKRLVLGGDPVDLTKEQVSRVQDTGVKLDKKSTS